MVKRVARILVLLFLCLMVIGYVIKRPSWVNRVPINEIPVKAELLKQHVEYLSHEISRGHDQLLENNAASNYIRKQFIEIGLKPELQPLTVDGNDYHNILIRLGPQSGPLTVVGAHYDAYDQMPGADDNASGVAGLIELARLLANTELSSPIELVAYTLEEPPYFAGENMGSFRHAELSKQKIKLMISLEMIGYFSDEENSQEYPTVLLKAIYPNKGNFIAVIDQLNSSEGVALKKSINKYSQIEAFSINAPAWIPGVDFSDHRNYWAKDIPAVMVTDTAFYRNEKYHTEQDTFETLDYHKMAQVVWGVYKHISQQSPN